MMSLLEKNLTLRVKNDKYFVSAGKVTRTRRLNPARDRPQQHKRWEPRPAEGVAGPCARAQRPAGAAPRGCGGSRAREAAPGAQTGTPPEAAGPAVAGRAEGRPFAWARGLDAQGQAGRGGTSRASPGASLRCCLRASQLRGRRGRTRCAFPPRAGL